MDANKAPSGITLKIETAIHSSLKCIKADGTARYKRIPGNTRILLSDKEVGAVYVFLAKCYLFCIDPGNALSVTRGDQQGGLT